MSKYTATQLAGSEDDMAEFRAWAKPYRERLCANGVDDAEASYRTAKWFIDMKNGGDAPIALFGYLKADGLMRVGGPRTIWL